MCALVMESHLEYKLSRELIKPKKSVAMLTSVREELGVDLLELVLVDNSVVGR